MSKPRVKVNPPASQYCGKDERIIEFSGGKDATGGLIAFRMVDGKLIVDLYRLDANVAVRCPAENVQVQLKEDTENLPK